MSFEVENMASFQAQMRDYAEASKKTAAQVVLQQAQKLISSDFREEGDGASRGGLYQEARKERFATISEIKALQHKGAKAATEGARIYRNQFGTFSKRSSRQKARSVENYAIKTFRFAGRGLKKKQQILLEIQRRIKVAGFVQSTGWLNRVYALRGKGVKTRTVKIVGKPRGRVIMNLDGGNPSITIINETPGAAEFAAKTGYFDRAVSNREQDMANYCHRKMLEAAQKSDFRVA